MIWRVAHVDAGRRSKRAKLWRRARSLMATGLRGKKRFSLLASFAPSYMFVKDELAPCTLHGFNVLSNKKSAVPSAAVDARGSRIS